MARSGLSKKDKIILLLKQGETSATIIANKVGCDPAYISVVRNEFLRSQKA
jgi:predicted DNA-binding ArsR family transcriptional regulator